MKIVLLLPLLLLASCANEEFMGGTRTAQGYYSALPRSQKKAFNSGYDLGANDAMQRMYEANNKAMRYDVSGYKDAALKTKTIAVPISQSYVDKDGVIHDPGYQYVQVRTVQ